MAAWWASHLPPGRRLYVEYSNEVSFGFGLGEVGRWVSSSAVRKSHALRHRGLRVGPANTRDDALKAMHGARAASPAPRQVWNWMFGQTEYASRMAAQNGMYGRRQAFVGRAQALVRD